MLWKPNTLLCTAAVGVALVTLFAIPEPSRAQDPARGKELFEKRCTGCHALDKEKEGPRLRGVYGRTSGSVSSFNYSDAVKKARITWDAASLDKWLTDPDKVIPENDMSFQVVKAEERADIIAYLKQLSGH
jgi:cytochrome c